MTPIEIFGEQRDEVLHAGTIVGRMRLERVVGEGGMGVVWAAREIGSERPFALKFLKEVRLGDPKSHARFVREAQAAMAVRHPNVAPVHAIELTPSGTPYLVMDLLEGETLRRRLQRSSPLALGECARILGPVVSAIRAAHAVGIVHRDLKPENVFLDARGVLVVDFGIAKTLLQDGTDATSLTSTGAMVGTPIYMAPEQIFGDADIDGRVDVWALGVILYECLSGCRPTEATGVGQVIKIITSESIAPLEQKLTQPVPSELCRLVMSMLSRRREDRPALDAVESMLASHVGAPAVVRAAADAGMATLDTAAPHSKTIGAPTPARKSRAWLALLAIPIAGIGAGAFVLARHADPAASVTSSAPLASSSAPVAIAAPEISVAMTQPSASVSTSSTPRARPAPAVAAKPSATSSSEDSFGLTPMIANGMGTAKVVDAVLAQEGAIKACFPPKAKGPDRILVATIVFTWPKNGPRTLTVEASETSPQGKAMTACVQAKLEAAPIPAANGQDDIGGQPARAKFVASYD